MPGGYPRGMRMNFSLPPALLALSVIAAMPALVVLSQGGLRREGIWLLFGVLGCAGIGALGAVVVARTASENRAQMRLLDAVRGLESLLKEKDILLGEVHHRVNNNLQMVVTLLHLEAAGSDDQVLSGHLDGLARRLALIGGLHARMYAADRFARLNVGVCLAEYCRASKVLWCGEDLRCDLETALSLALMADQLLWHGDLGRHHGAELHLERCGAEVLLSVVNLPAEGRINQRLTIVQALAQQIGATVDGAVVRIPGTVFES